MLEPVYIDFTVKKLSHVANIVRNKELSIEERDSLLYLAIIVVQHLVHIDFIKMAENEAYCKAIFELSNNTLDFVNGTCDEHTFRTLIENVLNM